MLLTEAGMTRATMEMGCSSWGERYSRREEGGGGGGGVLDFMYGRSRMMMNSRVNAETEHVGLSPTMHSARNKRPSAVRCPASRVKGEVHLAKNRL